MQITNQHLDFMNEAREAFTANEQLETYRNEENFELIALRYGFDRDCIRVFELGQEVALFVQQTPPTPRPQKDILNFAHGMENVLRSCPEIQGKDASYIYGSMRNIMDDLLAELSFHRNPVCTKRIRNMCTNLSAQAMLLANAAKKL